MNASPELRQQMWELCYDLLPPDERATLVTRIKSDPQAARLYAEVRLQADLVGYAAKVEDSSFVLSVGEKVAPVPTAASARGAAFAGRRAHGGSTWANWFSAAAALVLVGLIGYGYVRPLTIAQQVALGTIVEVEVPAELNEGLSYPIAVRTWGLQHDGREAHPEAAEVAVRLTGRDGDERFYKVIPTDESGEGQVELPGDALAPGVRLEVEALSRELTDSELTAGERAAAKRPAGPPVAVDLPVRPESELSYYFYERPAAPGEEIAGNRVDVKRFSLATTVNPTHQSALDGDRSGSGKAQESARAGYVDAQHPARALQRDKAPAELRKSLAADGAVGKPGDDRKEEERAKPRPSAKLADGSEGDTDSFQSNRRLKADIAKGDIAPTAEPAAAPASPPALPAAPFAGAAPASPVPPPAGPAPTGDGRAANSLAEQKRAERLQALAENLEKQTVAAGQGLVVEVPAELRDRKELIATATNRGITVASQAVGAAPQVKLALPPEVDGEIRIALVDPAQSPPEVL
ncbi:MAG: hypothetical protein SFU86_20610, partial [Pirellulaceae bacterium]|nr:hypothetical protein [Pirellulaceae bacterium]